MEEVSDVTATGYSDANTWKESSDTNKCELKFSWLQKKYIFNKPFFGKKIHRCKKLPKTTNCSKTIEFST
jgi:hypothetical protein